jgi:hypothetical protein
MPSSGMLRHVDLVKSRRFGAIVFLRSARRLIMDNVPRSAILFTLMMEAIRSSETSILVRATWRNIPEDDILHSHRRENFKSYIALTDWTL